MKVKMNDSTGVIITEPNDKFARADSRLITLINRIKREVKDESIESLFHHEVQYDKNENEILTFDTHLKEQIIKAINKNGYLVKE